jgi:protein-tyrosine phosphatase
VVRENLRLLLDRGYIPLIAHPERSPLFRTEPDTGLLDRLKGLLPIQNPNFKIQNSLISEFRSMGCLFQGNLGSFSGYYGEGVRQFAEQYRRSGLYHCYGTDAHRPEQIRAGSERLPEAGSL